MAKTYHSASRGNEVQATQCHSSASVCVSALPFSSPPHLLQAFKPKYTVTQHFSSLKMKDFIVFELFLEETGMESELVNLTKLQNTSLLAVLRLQVSAASRVFMVMSKILASFIHNYCVWSTLCFQESPAVQCLIMSPTMSRCRLEHMAMMRALILSRSCWMAVTLTLHPFPSEPMKLWKPVSNIYIHTCTLLANPICSSKTFRKATCRAFHPSHWLKPTHSQKSNPQPERF